MMKGLCFLLLLLLTDSLVTSRHVSQSGSTIHRLTKSGKKSKGKKGFPKDGKKNGKKGGKKGKKGKKGVADDDWEEGKKTNAQTSLYRVHFTHFAPASPISKYTHTPPNCPPSGEVYAPSSPALETASSAPFPPTAAPIPSNALTLPKINQDNGDSITVSYYPTSGELYAPATPALEAAPSASAFSRPVLIPSNAPSQPKANKGEGPANSDEPKHSLGRASPVSHSPTTKPDLVTQRPVQIPPNASVTHSPTKKQVLVTPRPVKIQLTAPVTHSPTKKPNVVTPRPVENQATDSAPAAPIFSPVFAPGNVSPVAPSLSGALAEAPGATSPILLSPTAPVLGTPIAPFLPVATSQSMQPQRVSQQPTRAHLVESTEGTLKPTSIAASRVSGPAVNATTFAHTPSHTVPLRTVPNAVAQTATSSPVNSKFRSLAPMSLHPLPTPSTSLIPITASPTAHGTRNVDSKHVYRREYTSSIITLVLEGDIDLVNQQAKMFHATAQQMQYYLVDVLGPVMEDFELSITYHYSRPEDDGRRLKGEVVYADLAVTLSLVDSDPALVKDKSQEDIDKILRGFFERSSLQKLQERLKETGVDVTALSTTFPSGEVSTTKGRSMGLLGVALAGGLLFVSIAGACLCKRRKCMTALQEADENTCAAVRSKSGSFVSKPMPDTLMIVPYEKAKRYQDSLLDAADTNELDAEKNGTDNKMIDDPYLVASTPGVESWNDMWDKDCHSIDESTQYSRSEFLDDRPRPEYDSRKMGQRFRPWDDDVTNQRQPIKKSRLMRPFQPRKSHTDDDSESAASASSMQPLVPRSRMNKKSKPWPESPAPYHDGQPGDQL